MRSFAVALLLILPLPAQKSGPPTVQEAQEFMDKVEKRLLDLSNEAGRASWIQSTYITHDTEELAAATSEKAINQTVEFVKQATRFDGLKMPADLARKFHLLKVGLTIATPSDPKESEALTRLTTGMESTYGKGKYCRKEGDCIDLQEITRIFANSRDESELRKVWKGWHEIAKPMKDDYARYVVLANKGAAQIGFQDTGAMWRSKYDLPPAGFAKEVDRLWEQVKPLYVSLHAYVRWKLREKYGDVVPEKGPIPAHLLGNVWAQQWDSIYELVAPKDSDPGYDLTKILKGKNIDAKEMVRYGERFFTSLGFEALPPTFWERSLFLKPRDREVVCHASAWDVDNAEDLRIKMCIDITDEDFRTIHHELGHNFYQRAYNKQPFLFRDSANDGFHEAIGDAIALSITPDYLVKLGFLKDVPPPSKDIGLLLRTALEKIAFLPFGVGIDQWRWKVFDGQIKPEDFTKSWWDLRLRYGGIAPPEPRTPDDFDPGAKYHVPANVPYTRYFLAAILQFQFHRALAQTAGCTLPLNRCSIYGSKEAGAKLNNMLKMGLSKPWPEALNAIAGTRQMDAGAIRDYFAPLQKWLDEQNRGKPVGW